MWYNDDSVDKNLIMISVGAISINSAVRAIAECSVRTRDGSLRGLDGGVERILNLLRRQADCHSSNSKLVKQLREVIGLLHCS